MAHKWACALRLMRMLETALACRAHAWPRRGAIAESLPAISTRSSAAADWAMDRSELCEDQSDDRDRRDADNDGKDRVGARRRCRPPVQDRSFHLLPAIPRDHG
jgi:hypothetical protein